MLAPGASQDILEEFSGRSLLGGRRRGLLAEAGRGDIGVESGCEIVDRTGGDVALRSLCLNVGDRRVAL
jgi:hypothetical protein